MESLCRFFQDEGPQVVDNISFEENSDGIEVTEIFPKVGECLLQTNWIPNGKVTTWLGREMSAGVAAPSDRPASIRIVWVTLRGICPASSEDTVSSEKYFVEKFGIRKSTFDLILRRFGMEYMYADRYASSRGLICLPTSDVSLAGVQSYMLKMTDTSQMLWRRDTTTGKIDAIYIGDKHYVQKVQRSMRHLKDLALHPMYLALVGCAQHTVWVSEGWQRAGGSIMAVETRTNHVHEELKDWHPAEGDYASLSAEMSGQLSSLANHGLTCFTLDSILDELSTFVVPKLGLPKKDTDILQSEFQCCVQLLKKRLKFLAAESKSISRRAEIQLGALFNLISHKDTQIATYVAEDSRTLASASKEDSTAMKTLAAVTVTFLPSTFIAALFSMPLFQWDSKTIGNSYVSRQFWIYWAVSIPLTCVTLVVWFAWTRWRMRQHRKQNEMNRESLHNLIAEEEV